MSVPPLSRVSRPARRIRSTARRIRSTAARSVADVTRHTETVWSGVLIALMVIAFAWILGMPTDKSAILSLVACFLVPCAIFPVYFVKNWRHPEHSDQWRALAPQVWRTSEHGPSMLVRIRHRSGAQWTTAYRCRLTTPEGTTYEASDNTPGDASGLMFEYPEDFVGAPQPTDGNYEIAWFVSGSEQRPLEVLRHTEVVTLP